MNPVVHQWHRHRTHTFRHPGVPVGYAGPVEPDLRDLPFVALPTATDHWGTVTFR